MVGACASFLGKQALIIEKVVLKVKQELYGRPKESVRKFNAITYGVAKGERPEQFGK
jgi:hypothetical protein